PQPGPIKIFKTFGGPGVRLDSGVTAGDTVSGAFDSLLAKIIVTGRDRAQALERARRALDEFEVAGMPTVLPFHRKVVREPAFTPAGSRRGSSTASPRGTASWRTPPSRPAATPSSSRWADGASRSACPIG